jgi:putative PIN family toxin of toxin-antitoxin system
MHVTRVVLDTNVCLDLFVFHDPRWQSILDALIDGSMQAITRADCRDEWLAVLHYQYLPVDDAKRPSIIAEFDRYIDILEPDSRSIFLPKCTDKDDQKFLEIARDAEVDILITKDKALLKLAKKTRTAALFQIMTPDSYLKQKMTIQAQMN